MPTTLASGTLYAEAQRRYLESVSPYARRLFHQMAVPEMTGTGQHSKVLPNQPY